MSLLRIVSEDPPPLVEAVGTHMADMAALWAAVVADGPSLEHCYGVVFGSFDRGQIEVSFAEHLPFLAWAQHLGLAFAKAERFGGASILLAASGPVTRDGRTATFTLRCATTQGRMARDDR